MQKNFPHILRLLQKHYPDAHCALNFKSPLQLLIATILSAQCTDVRVNKVTPALFAKYRTAKDFAEAELPELQDFIRTTGFFRNKAKNIQGACAMIVKKFHGEVPKTMPEFLQLPGVARKTANVVLFNAFGIQEGITVDTHMIRVNRRLGLTKQKTPEKIEKDLMALVPADQWGIYSHYIIEHGRKVCKAASPRCGDCFFNKLCPSAFRVS